MGIEITFLGSGTGFPRQERASPGILVKIPHFNILMDSGPGAMRQLARLGLTTNDIDIIMYTHLHPDHTVDIIDFLFCAKYQVVDKHNLVAAVNRFIASRKDGFRTKPFHLIGPLGFKNFYRRLKNLYGHWITASTYPLKITEVKNHHLKFRRWNLQTAEMFHEKTSVGYRINIANKSVVYSGDTGYCSNIVRLAKQTDLLILECSTSDLTPLGKHLTPSSAARIIRESGAKKAILTHIYEVGDKFDLLKQVRSKWKDIPAGKVRLARDLLKLYL